MAFKGLSDRFEEKYKTIYGKYSNRGPDGSGQPFLEFKPDDPHRSDTTHDNRFGAAYSVSYRRDLTRMTKFLGTGTGVSFLLKQAELQTGNTFSETRIINPLFVIGNVPGVTHIKRPLGSSGASSPGGNIGHVSIGVDGRVGAAGRLQKRTKEMSVMNRLGNKGPTGLLNLLPPNKITRTISSLQSVFGSGPSGVLDIDDRPEIDFQGQFYSTAIWRGFRPQGAANSSLDRATSALSKGDLKGAVSAIKTGISRVIRGTQAAPQTLVGNERGAVDSSSMAGYRYFVVDKNSGADRYLAGTINWGSYNVGVAGQSSTRPLASMGVFNRKAIKLVSTLPDPVSYSAKDFVPLSNEESNKIDNASKLPPFNSKPVFTTTFPPRPPVDPSLIRTTQQSQSQQSGFWRKVRTVGGALFGSGPAVVKNPTILQSHEDRRDTSPTAMLDSNPGFTKMTYPDLSLQSRYNAQKDSLSTDSQRDNWWKTFDPLKNEPTYKSKQSMNLGGGFSAGSVMPEDIATKKIKFDGGRYFHDNAELSGKLGIIASKGDSNPTSEEFQHIRNEFQETTDFIFYDFVNKSILPFRAFLSDINETVSPNVSEQQYIGRIERNIVYVGVVRELSFTFRVQAFSPAEMRSVWAKINMLTGLTFPSKYVSGFLVPPFTKLTIGSLFVDQPGYLKSLSYKFDDDGWEIDENYQAPMGVTVSVTFSIIEKRQMQTNSVFYPYGDADRGIKFTENNAGDTFTTTPTSPASNAPALSVIHSTSPTYA